jgi:hypothetical protein
MDWIWKVGTSSKRSPPSRRTGCLFQNYSCRHSSSTLRWRFRSLLRSINTLIDSTQEENQDKGKQVPRKSVAAEGPTVSAECMRHPADCRLAPTASHRTWPFSPYPIHPCPFRFFRVADFPIQRRRRGKIGGGSGTPVCRHLILGKELKTAVFDTDKRRIAASVWKCTNPHAGLCSLMGMVSPPFLVRIYPLLSTV